MYLPSSGSIIQTVAQATTATSVTSNLDPSVFGQTVTFTASVSAIPPGAGTPIGTVSFMDGATPIAACQSLTLNASGQAQCPVSTLAAGVHAISVSYSGSPNFAVSSGAVSQNVQRSGTTTAVASSLNPSTFGQSVTFTASVSSVAPGVGTPTGVISFSDGSTPIAACQNVSLNATGQAQCVLSTVAIGTRTINAGFAGSANFLASAGSLAQVVTPATSTMAVSSSLNPSIFGQAVTFTATVGSGQPGAGTPTGTVSFNIDGNLFCTNTALNASGQAQCNIAGGLPALSAGNRDVVAIYSGDSNFDPSSNRVPGGQIVNRANTTTVITNAGSIPPVVTVGQTIALNWAVNVVLPGVGIPAGNVTVSDGTVSCSAAVAAGTCSLTFVSPGQKTITVSYSGNANFNPSVASVSTTVNLVISGTITEAVVLSQREKDGELVPNVPQSGLAGVQVALSGSSTGSVTTGPGGGYSFAVVPGGSYTITPTMAGKFFDPISRSYTNLSANATGGNFTAYNIGTANRELKIANRFARPGQSLTVPVQMATLGGERTMAFSISYDINPLSTPTVACGSSVSGCTINVDTSMMPGKIGISITLPQPLQPGTMEAARVTFQSVATNLTNTPLTFTDQPMQRSVRNSTNDPLQTTYTNGIVIFEQGIEGDVACATPCRTGDGQLLANDVVKLRRLTVGLDTIDQTTNEFQRADTSPASTKGDGQLDSTDIVKVRRYAANLDPAQLAGGPTALTAAFTPSNRNIAAMQRMRIVALPTAADGRLRFAVELDGNGREAAISFSLGYDVTRLRSPIVTLGEGLRGAPILTINSTNPGMLTVLIDSDRGFLDAGPKKIIIVTFDGKDGSGSLHVDDSKRISISDAFGEEVLYEDRAKELGTTRSSETTQLNGWFGVLASTRSLIGQSAMFFHARPSFSSIASASRGPQVPEA